MEDLSAAGLNPTESKCYRALLTKPAWLPSELAKNVQETRTNVYKILDKLCGLKLAERLENDKKLRFRAANPARLIELSQELRSKREQAEQNLELQTQGLMAEYIKVHEQPGVSYYQGQAEIGKIFDAIAQSKEEVVFIHTTAGADFYGFNIMHELRMKAVRAGVPRRGLTPDSPQATIDYAETDPKVSLQRTWLDAHDYTAPVEWGAFDNKLYIISYGNEAMGMIIESQQVAGSFKQLFSLLERGQTLQPGYNKLPKLAQKPGVSR